VNIDVDALDMAVSVRGTNSCLRPLTVDRPFNAALRFDAVGNRVTKMLCARVINVKAAGGAPPV
jgi:hypothetical protein